MPRARRAAAPRAEVEGFLAGVEHALELRRRGGRPDPAGEAEVRRARAELARGATGLASELLEALDGRLRAEEGEPGLHEIPRGLVGYVPRGGADRPLAPEEEPLAHRRLLILRLVEISPLAIADRDAALRELSDAARAIAAGDHAAARRAIDAAHRIVEGAPAAGSDIQ